MLPRPAFDQNYVAAIQGCGELWEPVELVRLLDIMPEEAKNTAERGAIIAGVIEGRYRIDQDNKRLRLDAGTPTLLISGHYHAVIAKQPRVMHCWPSGTAFDSRYFLLIVENALRAFSTIFKNIRSV